MFYSNVNIGLFYEDFKHDLSLKIFCIDAKMISNFGFVNFRIVDNIPESVEGKLCSICADISGSK